MADAVFLCPQERDCVAIERLRRPGREIAVVGEDIESSGPVDIDALVRACSAHQPRSVVATKDRSALLAAIVSERLGLGGPSSAALINCQHKLRSRVIQERVVPEATPAFRSLVELDQLDQLDQLTYPCFVKPVVGRLSDSVVLARGPADLARLEPGRAYAREYQAIATQAGLGVGVDECSGYLAEDVLSGAEVTLEGFVLGGNTTVLGITDSLKYAETSSFERFEYPTALTPARKDELARLAETLLPALGFDGGLFNIEFFVPEVGPAKIVEVNGRMASQFAPLLEHVHGRSSYDALLAVALGDDPGWPDAGSARFALSYCLRVFDDALVEDVPRVDDDVELLVAPGKSLSSQGTNDLDSYRLCIFPATGSERASTLAAARRRAEKLLHGFSLRPAPAAGAETLII